MNQDNEISELMTTYLQICRRLDTLINEASQDNASARMAYDQCNIALQNCKETAAHYLHELQQADAQQRDYFLQASRQTLQTFQTLVHDAEVKVRNARPMPPFLY
ncbi:MAG: hypothetical protein ACU83N_07715 [Gammaproteobacteria bacterium]